MCDKYVSKIIGEMGDFTLWYSEGDELPYWYSDFEGTEIDSFKTERELISTVNKEPRGGSVSRSLKLMQSIANIAYIAGVQNYYSDDSVQDVLDFIAWAEEFERTNQHRYEDDDFDYLIEIDKFMDDKFREKREDENNLS